jgi:predicted DNA-binding protein
VPKDKKFVNPLTQSSETLPATETPTLPSTSPITYTSTLTQAKHRKRGAQAFEKTHERITLWIDSALKQQFEALADEQGMAKSTLLDEAISDVLEKYEHPELSSHRDTLEERFRTDTQVHHFKKWLRTHDHPEGTDFYKRFLVDGQLPQHASRGLYEAKMRAAGYNEEDVHLFRDAWKLMLAEDLKE